MYIVELEGVEPSSKRGSNLLSTCLASFWLSGKSATEAIILIPYLLNFREGAEASPNLSPIYLHHLIGTLRSHSFRVMSCSATWWQN